VITTEAQAQYERWELPEVGEGAAGIADADTSAVNQMANPGLMTAGQLEKIQQQAREEGFSQGRQEGLAQGQAIIRDRVQSLERICTQLNKPLQELDQLVVDELTELTVQIARHLIRRELKTEPGQIIAVIRQALGQLPLAARSIRLYLNPEDAQYVRATLTDAATENSWEIVEDPVLSRGGCRVVTETSQIDATLEKRLALVVTELLGGDRGDDGSQ